MLAITKLSAILVYSVCFPSVYLFILLLPTAANVVTLAARRQPNVDFCAFGLPRFKIGN